MADKKISALVSLAGKDVAATDVFPVVDVSVAETKSLTRDELRNAVNAIQFTATKALATTAAASLPDDTIIEVAADESLSGARTRYKVAAGALVFAVNLDQLRVDLADTSDPAKGAALVGFLPAGTGAVARNVRDKLRETVSVKDFGAVGDGVANDRAAITAAVTAATGKALYFPTGIYLLYKSSGDSTQSFIGNLENIEIYGDGDSSVVKIANGTTTSGTNASAILNARSNCYIHDIKLDGNRANITAPAEKGDCVLITGSVGTPTTNVQVQNVTAINANNDCFSVNSQGGLSEQNDIRITGCRAANPGRSLFVVAGTSKNVNISQNFGYGPCQAFLDLEGDISGHIIQNFVADSNVFEGSIVSGANAFFNCTGSASTYKNISFTNNVGVNISGGTAIGGPNVSNMVFSGNRLVGKVLGGNKFMLDTVGGFKTGVIAGNIIEITESGATGGMWIRGADDVTISGNIISNVGYSAGIFTDDSGTSNGNSRIIGNTIKNCFAGSGIVVSGNQNASIIGNHVEVNNGFVYGINASANRPVVSGNTVEHIGTASGIGIKVASHQAVISNNNVTGVSTGIENTNRSKNLISGNKITGTSGTGIYIDTSSNYISICDNYVVGAGNRGIYVGSGVGHKIDGNTVMNTVGSAGIEVLVSNVSVINNLVTDDQTTKTQTYGIVGTNGTNNHICMGNYLVGNLTGAFNNFPPGANYWPKPSGVKATDMANFNQTV